MPAVLEHPQVLERGLLKTFESVPNIDRPVRVVRSGFRLASGDPEPASPPPTLGADTGDLLGEMARRELGGPERLAERDERQRDVDELAREGAI